MKIENVKPVAGAAKYFCTLRNEIVMQTPEGNQVIDKRKTAESALKCANSWQRRENKAVLKSQGII